MRAALAIIFSLVVVLGQTAAPACALMPLQRACCHCVCKDQSCGYGQSSRTAPSSPLAPVRQVSSEQLQMVLREAMTVIAEIETPVAQALSQSEFFYGSSAVPLYERNCSLLI